MPVPVIPIAAAEKFIEGALAGLAAYGLTFGNRGEVIRPEARPVGPRHLPIVGSRGTRRTSSTYNTPGVEVSDATRVARPVYVAPAKRKVRTLVTSTDANRALDKLRDAEKARRDSAEVARRNIELELLKQERDSLQSVLKLKNKEPENKKPDENKPELEKPKNENKGDTPNEKKKNFILRGVNRVKNTAKKTPGVVGTGIKWGLGLGTAGEAVNYVANKVAEANYPGHKWSNGPFTKVFNGYMDWITDNDSITWSGKPGVKDSTLTTPPDTLSTSNNIDNSAKVFEVMKLLNLSNGTDTLTNR